ncbi:MAG: VPLPA-CTERM sorting domain-containing protein [Gammaproteobacteria bacterium]|nr:VPLPA-CTERM sorting domain-containing protein [Gammaproteobacteria bacterium]
MKFYNISKILLVASVLFSTSSYAAFSGFPVPPEYGFSGNVQIVDPSGTYADSVVDPYWDPGLGDFSFDIIGILATAHDSTFYSAGSYTFMSTPDLVFPDSIPLYMTVGADQLGMHTLIDWNANTYDVLTVWDIAYMGNDILYTAIDMDGDGIRGYQHLNGPYAGMNFIMDMTIATPVPAAVWLFGSGLLMLMGIARKRK